VLQKPKAARHPTKQEQASNLTKSPRREKL